MKTLLRRLGAALLILVSTGPLSASHLSYTVTRSPGGPVLAGTEILVTAHVENTATTGPDLAGATLNTAFTDPHLALLSGTVTTRFLENADPAGEIVLGNSPGDDDVHMDLHPIPSGWTAEVRFRMVVASVLPAGVDEAFTQVFLTYCESEGSDCQSIPSFVVVPILAEPELRLNKTDFGVSVRPGGLVTYNLIATNVGSREATGLILTDTVPPGTRFDRDGSHPDWSCAGTGPGSLCRLTFDSLAPGDPRGFGFALVADAAPVPAGVDFLRNTASLTDDGSGSSSPKRAFDVETTPLLAAPDLSVTKSDGGVTARAGETVAYTLSYANRGDQDATGVVLEETVPENARFAGGASSAGWSCTPASGAAGAVCSLAVGELGGGSSGTAVFAVAVEARLPAGVEQIANTAAIRDDGANGPDGTPGDNQATETTPVEAVPDLRLTKSDGGVTARPGETVAYTLSYANRGSQDARGVILEETVPFHSTFDSEASSPGWICSPISGPPGTTCTLPVGDLAAGGSGEAVFAVTVADTVTASVEELLNIATVADDGANGADPTPQDNRATDTTPVEASPDLRLSKNDGGVTARPGELVSYTLAWANRGTQTATGVAVRETVPEHTRFAAAESDGAWSCSPGPGAGSVCTLLVGLLPAGDSGSATFAVRLDGTLPAGVEEIRNLASVADDGAHGPDPSPGDNEASETTPVEAAPDLALQKTASAAVVRPGETLTYTLTATNHGAQTATGVVLEDTIPPHSLFAEEESTAGWTCVAPLGGLRGEALKAERIQEALKAERIQDPVAAGFAPNGLAEEVVCTFALGDLSPGEERIVSFAVTLADALPAAVEELVNLARVSDDGTNGPDPRPGDNEASETTPVEAAPDLALQKTASAAVVRPGETLTYTLTATNQGDQAATGVVLDETIPPHGLFAEEESTAGWTCVAPLGGLRGEALKAERIQEALKAERIQGTQDITADAEGLKAERIQGRQDLTADADGLKAERIQDPVAAGVAPNGLADVVCTFALGNLSPGEERTVSFAVTLADALPAGVEELVNVSVVRDDGSQGEDPEPDDNEASVTTPVEAAPDLVLDKEASADLVHAGDTLVYTLSYRNEGSQGALGVVLEESLPEAVSFLAGASTAGWSCPSGPPAAVGDALKAERIQGWSEIAPDRQGLKAERIQLQAQVVCTLAVGALGPGEAGAATFAVRVADPVPAGLEELVNLARVSDDGTNGPDLRPGDNEASVTTPVEADPDDPDDPDDPPPEPEPGRLDLYLADLLAEDRDESGGASPGDVLSYSAEVVAPAEVAAPGAVLTVPIPPDTAFVPGSLRGLGDLPEESDGEALTIPLGDLAPGERVGLVWDVRIAEELPEDVDRVVAWALVEAEGLPEHPSDDPDTPELDDPTVTLLDGGGGDGEPVPIPTAGEWALLLLALLLTLGGWRLLRWAPSSS